VSQSAPKQTGLQTELELPDVPGDSGARGDVGLRGGIVSHTLRRISDSSPLDRAINEARDSLIAQQH
jgi:hypothetical protein